MGICHEFSRCHEIADVGRKIGVGKIAFAFTKPGEIKSHHGDPVTGQRPADMADGLDVFGTGKTMGKQGIGSRFIVRREIQPG